MSCCKKGPNWTDSETKMFLELCIDKQIINIMDGKRYKHIDIFKTLVPQMEVKGYFKSAEQMKLKLRNLKQTYFKCKRENSVSGSGKNTCPFYEELDLLYGGRPNIQALENDGIDSAVFNRETADEEEIISQGDVPDEPNLSSVEISLLEEPQGDMGDPTVAEDTVLETASETPKRKRENKTHGNNKYQKFEYSGRKSYENALNNYSEKMLQGQKNVLESLVSKQTEAYSEIFQREMEAQRNWEEQMMEREREFQREQTNIIMQSFQQSLQTLRPTNPIHSCTPLKLIPMQRREALANNIITLGNSPATRTTIKNETVEKQN